MNMINYKNDVRMSHELNHLKGAFTKLELDFTYSFVSMIKKEDVELMNYTLSLAELEKKMNRRLQLKDIEYLFNTLTKKEFKVHNVDKLEIYTFFTYLCFNKTNNTLTVDFNKRLKPHLLDLQHFALGNLKYILAYKSEYTKRIYMLICQWKNSIKSKKYSIEELREILEIPQSYLYADFKRRVIDKAKQELEEKGDYYFKYKEQKEGKKVVGITFTVHENIKLKREKEQPTIPDTELAEELKQYIGKQIYQNGYYWKIISISKNGNLYSIFCHEIDDKTYTKILDFSEVQLRTAAK